MSLKKLCNRDCGSVRTLSEIFFLCYHIQAGDKPENLGGIEWTGGRARAVSFSNQMGAVGLSMGSSADARNLKES
jgi:hypothetical protein